MGYYASVSGSCYLRPLTEEEKNTICDELGEKFGYNCRPTRWPEMYGPMNDLFVTESDNGVEVEISGYDRYDEDNWEDYYNILQPYLDYTQDNSFEFVGKDNSTWRFRFTKDGLKDDYGMTVYDNEIPYAICINESYVRDAQYRTNCLEDAEDGDEDGGDEDAWTDCFGPVFIKMVRASSAEEAIDMVARAEGYDASILAAFTC